MSLIPAHNVMNLTAAQLPIDRNPVAIYLASLPSAGSRRVMRIALEGLWRLMQEQGSQDVTEATLHFPWWELRYQHTQAIRSRLLESGLSLNTINTRLAALRGVLKECWRLGLMAVEDYQRVVDIRNVKGEQLPAGRDVPDKELRALLLSCYQDGKIGVRDIATIGLLATTGMRRAEFEALTYEDFDPETGSLHIRKGKGRKERVVYVVNTARRLLDEWLALRGTQPGPLFLAFRKGGHITQNRMGAQAVYNMVVERAKALGLPPLSPHDFRRTFVGNMLDAGVDTVTLAKITGHANIDLLKRYDRRPEKAKLDAQSKIDLPL